MHRVHNGMSVDGNLNVKKSLKIFDDPYAVELKASGSMSADYDLTLPAADGTADQIMKTDGSGVLSFSSALAALSITNLTYATAANTATDNGTTTAIIADTGMLQFVVPTSANAAHIIVLPTPTPGTIVILAGTANGYELRSSAPATVAINGGAETGAQSAIAASTMVVAICESATSWKAFQMGSDGTLAQVEAAAAEE